VICLPGTSSARRTPPPEATTLCDWLVCLGLKRAVCGGVAVTNHKSVLQAGTTRSQEVFRADRGHQ
jgi:hypothetical protein